MDFSLNAEQRALRDKARGFAKTRLSEVAGLIADLPTPEARFAATRPVYEDLVKEGFMQRLIPAPFGGGGTGVIDMAVVAEEFHAVDVNVPLTMLANLLGLTPIFMAATPEQQKAWIAPFLRTSGAPLAALCNSEPGGSANFDAPAPAEGTRTTARLDGDHWVLNGRKQWVSSATGWDGRGADILAVVCRTGEAGSPDGQISVLCVEGPAPGIRLERAAQSMGFRAHLTPRFALENVRTPKGHLIGPLGGGRDIVAGSFIATAALVGVFATALMRAAFDFSLAFARREKRGGAHPILEHQAVGYALADAKGKLEASRALSWRACWAADAGSPGAAELALHSKVYCSELAVGVIVDLMRIVGIDSYDHELPLAGWLQDAIALPLFDGGNMGVRRKQLHGILRDGGYDPLATVG
jgi:alkylation response protein AidB-like acyl-CoA dehydrogenase